MGFRCPVCLKDFDRNKKAWQRHIKKCCNGITKEFVHGVLEMTKNKKRIGNARRRNKSV